MQLTTHNGDNVDSEGAGTVAIDINQVGESALPQEGTIIFTGEDGTQSEFPFSFVSVGGRGLA